MLDAEMLTGRECHNIDPDIDFSSPEYLSMPWGPLKLLAENAPVFWSEKLNAWVLTRHADVKAAYVDQRLSARRMEMHLRRMTAVVSNPEERFPVGLKYARARMAFMDGFQHRRIRTLMLSAFSKKVVERTRQRTIELIDGLLDKAEEAGEFEFFDLIGKRLPTQVIQAILGVPDSDPPEFYDLSMDLQMVLAGASPTPEQLDRFERATIRMNEIFRELIAQRRQAPTDDILSELVHARDNLDKLSDDELLAACSSIISAGSETNALMLGTGVFEVAQNPALVEMLRTEVDAEKHIVLELLRFPGVVRGMFRLAGEDLALHGKQLMKGDLVYLCNAAANVDPDVFPDPMTIDPRRPPRQLQDSMAFGPGIHHCIGHLTAKMELEEFFKRAFARFDIEILQHRLEFIDTYVLRGFKELRVRFTPRNQVGLSCCRFRGHRDKVFLEPEGVNATTEIQPRD